MSEKKYLLTESSIHYAVGFLQRYTEQYPNKKHQEALKEFRNLSNTLLEHLSEPYSLGVVRHKNIKPE